MHECADGQPGDPSAPCHWDQGLLSPAQARMQEGGSLLESGEVQAWK